MMQSTETTRMVEAIAIRDFAAADLGDALALPLGATTTTAASGGSREELLGQRPAGHERQRNDRWEPQPGAGERSETERVRMLKTERRL